MKWIDEMFANVEVDRAAAEAKKSANGAKAGRTTRPKKQILDASNAWDILVSSIAKDVEDFNKHQQRAGENPVCISQRPFQCEVHVPGMHGKRLVLNLENNDLHVSVHPDFPKQQLTITVEPEQDGQHTFWFLGEATKESAKLSVQELSEYVLKPIFSAAATDRDR
jgi:hypothetical protein